MSEAAALRDLAARELSSLPRGIGDMHHAISGRVFGALGPVAAPVRLVHDTIARGVYASVSAGVRATALVPVPDVELSETPRGAMALGALNGLLGDTLDPPLAIPTAVRRAGEPATPRLAVFVHGLGETEYAWGSPSYGDRLHEDLGITPVFVRYNTGRHISESGASLAALMDDVVASWPVEVEQIALIGHSMGGLVGRSACHHGGDWTPLVRHTISLGTPHDGAPLEQAVHAMSAGLNLVPETRPFSRFLRRRSAGIRDLRRGSLVDEDWRDKDPDALRAKALTEVPLLEGATHCFVAATVTRSPTHPVGRLLGDTLVLSGSASGKRIGFEEANGLALGGTHHLALLNHPEVYDRLRSWL
jgi:pimeloyl-ACP methyl ester carboxylesterase